MTKLKKHTLYASAKRFMAEHFPEQGGTQFRQRTPITLVDLNKDCSLELVECQPVKRSKVDSQIVVDVT